MKTPQRSIAIKITEKCQIWFLFILISFILNPEKLPCHTKPINRYPHRKIIKKNELKTSVNPAWNPERKCHAKSMSRRDKPVQNYWKSLNPTNLTKNKYHVNMNRSQIKLNVIICIFCVFAGVCALHHERYSCWAYGLELECDRECFMCKYSVRQSERGRWYLQSTYIGL